jgi:hypothetical protein
MNDAQRAKRRRLVKAALWLTQQTPMYPSLRERQLLAQYVQGKLTIDQVIILTEKLVNSDELLEE